MSEHYFSEFFKPDSPNLAYSYVLDSKISGPHLVIFGGVHGHEFPGVLGILEFLKLNKLGVYPLKKGKITFVLGNPEACIKKVRFVEENLNRVFSENLPDNLEGKRAFEIRKFIEHNSDIVSAIDLHTTSSSNSQMTIFVDPNSKKLALELNPYEILFDFEKVNGMKQTTLMNEFSRRGIPAIAFENGHNHWPESTQNALEVILRYLSHYEMIDYTKHPNEFEFVTIYQTVDIVRTGNGFKWAISDEEIDTDRFFKQGELIATTDKENQFAEKDCYLFMPDKHPSPKDHDAGFLCTKEVVEMQNVE